MPCLVDLMANTMVPRAIRSVRGTSLFHLLQVGWVWGGGGAAHLLPCQVVGWRGRAGAAALRIRCVPHAAWLPAIASHPRTQPHAHTHTHTHTKLHLQSESTGTSTFTLFAPAGGGGNLTAFHFETKRRRSYNLGTGDFIVQPVATASNTR